MGSEGGTIRIAGTRVRLDSVLHHSQQGATAEEIVLRFPALRLADMHACLAYYLNHPSQVEEYGQSGPSKLLRFAEDRCHFVPARLDAKRITLRG